MAFTAHWLALPKSLVPDDRDPSFYIEGNAFRYRIDWGDGTRSIVEPQSDRDGDGLKDAESSDHRYSDGIYNVSISQGARGRTVANWQVIWAEHATTDLDVRGSSGGDFIRTGIGNDVVHAVDGDDVLIGGDGDDRLIGGRNDTARSDLDRLYGGWGDDILVGGAGSDRLEGGNGVDRLVGGPGSDIFAFVFPRTPDRTAASQFDSDRDVILDFEQGFDKLDLSGWTNAHPTRFIDDAEFSGIKNRGELRVS